jgi:hypothetical protein
MQYAKPTTKHAETTSTVATAILHFCGRCQLKSQVEFSFQTVNPTDNFSALAAVIPP